MYRKMEKCCLVQHLRIETVVYCFNTVAAATSFTHSKSGGDDEKSHGTYEKEGKNTSRGFVRSLYMIIVVAVD